jgi:hypothetical protein
MEGRSHCQSLFSDAKALDNGAISGDILILQVIKKATPLSDHSQEASARMVILCMDLKMLRQVSYFFAQNGDLHFRRPCIRWVSSICIDDFRLLFYRK